MGPGRRASAFSLRLNLCLVQPGGSVTEPEWATKVTLHREFRHLCEPLLLRAGLRGNSPCEVSSSSRESLSLLDSVTLP